MSTNGFRRRAPGFGTIGRGCSRYADPAHEGREKVTGATRFTADLEVAGLLHVQLVLSHLASARIRGIETAAARAVPGVVDVCHGRDLPEQRRRGSRPAAGDRPRFLRRPAGRRGDRDERGGGRRRRGAVEVDFEETAGRSPTRRRHAGRRRRRCSTSHEEADEDDASIHGAASRAESEPVERPRNVSGVALAEARRRRGGAGRVGRRDQRHLLDGRRASLVHGAARLGGPPGARRRADDLGANARVRSTLRDDIAQAPGHPRAQGARGVDAGRRRFRRQGHAARRRCSRCSRVTCDRPLRLALTRQQEFVVGHGCAGGAVRARARRQARRHADRAARAIPLRQRRDRRLARRHQRARSSAGTYRWPELRHHRL